MKYWMAFSVAALAVGCSNQKNTRPATPAPAQEPVNTTTVTTTSAALTVTPSPSRAEPDSGNSLLTSRIRQRLNLDRTLDDVRLDAVHIHEADGGHVTIDGYVGTLADSVEIERIVRGMDGVVAVKNELRLDGDLR
jgi:osmotically-inducible protein OsmY